MFSNLQNLEHPICTAYGNSSASYGGALWTVPMQGVYQGNGARPTIWAVISPPLLLIMKEEGFGTFFWTSITDDKLQLVGYTFVDDTDLVQTGKTGQETVQEVLVQIQAGIDLWGRLFKATGGACSLKRADGGYLILNGIRTVLEAIRPTRTTHECYLQKLLMNASKRSLGLLHHTHSKL
jgi:hypothetical protein